MVRAVMSGRGWLTFMLITTALGLDIFLSCADGTDKDFRGIEAILALLLWTLTREVLLSLGEFNWKLSIATAVASFLEWRAIICYANFTIHKFYPSPPLNTVLLVAIPALVMGRIVDVCILRPYFPRKTIP